MTLGLVMAAVVFAVIGVTVVLLTGEDDETAVDPVTTTETTSITTSSSASTTRAPGALSELESATIVWPDPGTNSYDDPVAVAETFAVEVIGFDEPQVGDFDDEGVEDQFASGAVEIRARPGGPTTLVRVGRMSDDAWYVVGATAEDFDLAEPDDGVTVDGPSVEVAGVAPGLEGPLVATVRLRSDDEPIGGAVVFVDDEQSGVEAFDGDVSFDPPGEGFGSVIVMILDEEDQTVEQAAAVPIRFGPD